VGRGHKSSAFEGDLSVSKLSYNSAYLEMGYSQYFHIKYHRSVILLNGVLFRLLITHPVDSGYPTHGALLGGSSTSKPDPT
jgi:hypothetical protein